MRKMQLGHPWMQHRGAPWKPRNNMGNNMVQLPSFTINQLTHSSVVPPHSTLCKPASQPGAFPSHGFSPSLVCATLPRKPWGKGHHLPTRWSRDGGGAPGSWGLRGAGGLHLAGRTGCSCPWLKTASQCRLLLHHGLMFCPGFPRCRTFVELF